jgi:hypothetical protein
VSFGPAQATNDGNVLGPAFADLNGDGRIDYVAQHGGDVVHVLLNTSQAVDTPTPSALTFASAAAPQPLRSIGRASDRHGHEHG